MSAFRFKQPQNLGVFVCDNVRVRGMPVLNVSHDEDGDWQFLCGGEHSDVSDDSAALVCLKDVVENDASLNQLAELCPLQEASRDAPGAPWQIHDRMEDIVRENVANHGCHVMLVSSDGEAPAFAYSIGLTRTHGQPELICFGLREEVMHFMINELGERMAGGARFHHGDRISGLIDDYDCILRRTDRARYREYLGYALWFNEGDGFDVLQIVWPDKQKRYPWEPDYAAPRGQQPATWSVG